MTASVVPGPVAPGRDQEAEARARAAGAAASSLAGVGVGLLAGRAVGIHLPACPFLAVTGVPCPFCGITRLADALAHLRVGEAVAASPAGVALIVGLAVVAIAHLAARARHRPPPAWLGSRLLPVLAAVVVVAHWATSVVRGLPT